MFIIVFCNCVGHMINYVNFKLSKDFEKNPGPTKYDTDHHEVIIRPSMQNHRSTMQLTSSPHYDIGISGILPYNRNVTLQALETFSAIRTAL